MSRIAVRLAAASVALLATAGVATPADAATPASGSAVVGLSRTFVQQAAAANMQATVGSPATAAYDSTTGALNATFPVTGGNGSIAGFWGSVQLGGSFTVTDSDNGKSVTFTNLSFNMSIWRMTGIPAGSTTAVSIVEPTNNTITTSGATEKLNSQSALLDGQGAQYLDTQLNTTFFTAGQSLGSFSISYTPAS